MGGLTVEELKERLEPASKDLKQVLGEAFAGLLLFGSYPRGDVRGGFDPKGPKGDAGLP